MKFEKEDVLEIIQLSKNILTDEIVIQKFEHEQKITIVGDTHGQFFDLLKLLKNNGWPEEKNPYIFNGDFVDRGAYGCEVLILILLLKLSNPTHVLLNRGNHKSGA